MWAQCVDVSSQFHAPVALIVAVLIKLGTGRPNNRGLIAGSGKTIFSSSKHLDSLRVHLEFYPLEPGGGGWFFLGF